jgi:hypothetical protein
MSRKKYINFLRPSFYVPRGTIGAYFSQAMSPRETIAALYERYPQDRNFEEDEALHRMTGYVLESDDYYLMGRGVWTQAGQAAICEPFIGFPRHRQDCWMLWAYCGPLGKIYELQPYKLPLVGWVRRNGRLRIYWIEEFREHIGRICESKRSILLSLGNYPG